MLNIAIFYKFENSNLQIYKYIRYKYLKTKQENTYHTYHRIL